MYTSTHVSAGLWCGVSVTEFRADKFRHFRPWESNTELETENYKCQSSKRICQESKTPIGEKENVRTVEYKTAFTRQQLARLEVEFSKGKYVKQPRKWELADQLGLRESTIQTWFQRRRRKAKLHRAAGAGATDYPPMCAPWPASLLPDLRLLLSPKQQTSDSNNSPDCGGFSCRNVSSTTAPATAPAAASTSTPVARRTRGHNQADRPAQETLLALRNFCLERNSSPQL